MVATMVEHYDDDNVETRARLALVKKELRRRENLYDAVAAKEEAVAKAANAKRARDALGWKAKEAWDKRR